MKKMLLGLTAVFALTAAAPAFAGDDAAGEKPAKAEKKGGKGGKKGEKKEGGEDAAKK